MSEFEKKDKNEIKEEPPKKYKNTFITILKWFFFGMALFAMFMALASFIIFAIPESIALVIRILF